MRSRIKGKRLESERLGLEIGVRVGLESETRTGWVMVNVSCAWLEFKGHTTHLVNTEV